MSEPDIVEAEIVALAPTENLLAAPTGRVLIERATERADALAEVIDKKQLFKNISGKRHVLVEGWTLLGSMMGVFPVTEWVHEVTDEDGKKIGFEARVEARTLAGQVVGAAIARCVRTENSWKSRDDYALMSMCQTRAVSKALRMPLGFVMSLAGFEATPAEEMPHVEAPVVVEEPSPRVRLGRVIKDNGIEVGYAKAQMALRYGGVTESKDLTDEQVLDFVAFLHEGHAELPL